MNMIAEVIDPRIISSRWWSKEGERSLDELKLFSKLEGHRIGWNYPLDYCWLADKFEEAISLKASRLDQSPLKIVDVGCGPGAVHGFLEKFYGVEIIGVDLNRWDTDYVDYVGDFSSKEFREGNDLNDIDILISTSAFEHNSISQHRRLVNECRKALSRSGDLIVTHAISSNGRSSRFKHSGQLNLSPSYVEEVYAPVRLLNRSEISNIRREYLSSQVLRDGFVDRFPNLDLKNLNFLSVGVFAQGFGGTATSSDGLMGVRDGLSTFFARI